ncbi:MAG: hypothetical protein HY353_02090 [Candidatus Omnitrophica bacterium]|nr:hypothetical protein [Candidatus Omnitrophota bacterium]
MPDDVDVGFRYQPRYCALLGKYVWAIRTRQADGTWRTVNCLDKDEPCFSVACTFTTERGEWPFRSASTEQMTPKVQ